MPGAGHGVDGVGVSFGLVSRVGDCCSRIVADLVESEDLMWVGCGVAGLHVTDFLGAKCFPRDVGGVVALLRGEVFSDGGYAPRAGVVVGVFDEVSVGVIPFCWRVEVIALPFLAVFGEYQNVFCGVE